MPELLIAGLASTLLWRGISVYHFRYKLESQAMQAALEDLLVGDIGFPWTERRDAVHKVPFLAMLLQFWRPLKAAEWYSDTWFLRPSRPRIGIRLVGGVQEQRKAYFN